VLSCQRTIAGLPYRAATGFLIAFAIAFGMYLGLWKEAPVLQSDSGGYLKAAQDLSDLHIDQLQDRPPGYPLFLLLTGSSAAPGRALVIASLAMHFVSIWLLAALLSRAGSSQVALLGFCLVLLMPPYVESAGYVLSENLAEAMLVLTFVGIVRWADDHRTTWMLLAAGSVACAALTRPTFQYLPIALAVCLCLAVKLRLINVRWGRVAKASAVLVGGSAVLITGYAWSNYRSFGHFTLSPIVGFALSTKTAGVLERLPEEYAPVKSVLIQARNEDAATGQFRPGASSIFKARAELTRITGLEGAALSEYLVGLNMALIRRAPLTFLDESMRAFGAYWFPSSGELANFHSTGAQAIWALLHFTILGVFAVTLLLFSGLATICITIRKQLRVLSGLLSSQQVRRTVLRSVMCIVAVCVVFYTAIVSSVIGVGDPRYRMPTDVLIVFIVFTGLAASSDIAHIGASIANACARAASPSYEAANRS
jgi:hypothetical protein